MSLLSILLSVVAVLCTVLGFLATPVPVLGAVLSFGAAAIALGGIMLAGRAMSRAKLQERPSDTARIGVVLNVLALVPALLVALTCGVCNALVSTGNMQASPNFRFHVGPQTPSRAADPDVDDGQQPAALAPPAHAGAGQAAPKAGHGTATAPATPSVGRAPDRQAPPAAPAQPSNLPPPPLPAGPGK